MEQPLETSRALMLCIKKILTARPLAIQMMRETPSCNLDVIRRGARDLRDPNPMQTTMSVLSRKYPISLDANKADKCEVPKELLTPVKDNHRRNRILARMETVDWWINSAPLPSHEQIGFINIMYEFPRKEVNDYFKINWRGTSVKFNQVLLSKERVPARAPMVRVPKSLQESMIMQLLLPDHVIRYEATNPELEEGHNK